MDKNDQLFGSLIYLFHTTGMQGLGKLMNPVSQKIEKNPSRLQLIFFPRYQHHFCFPIFLF